MSGSQFLNLKAKGLSTLSNPLSAVQDGSLAESINVVIDRNEVIEPRRGFAKYGDTFGDGTDRTKQILNYKDVILRHVLSTLQYDSNAEGTFVDFAGSTTSEIKPGLRIKSIEANGNLYFTTINGVKKLSAKSANDFSTIAIQDAGGTKALDVTGLPNYTNSGFLEANSKVAYRIIWGYKDNNDNLILGSPSARAVVSNVSTTNSCFVDLEFAIPNEIQTTNYFYQIYRTGITTGEITPSIQEATDPGDEMYLVIEDNVTAAELLAGKVNVVDITPEDFRKNGTLLYSNPNSGDGIESANEKPPFAQDIALYKNYTFYANTSTVQRLNFAFLSVIDFVSNVTNFVVRDGTSTNTYLFQGSMESYTADFTGGATVDFYNAAPGTAKYFTLQSANDSVKYCVWYSQSADDQEPALAGYLNIKTEILVADTLSDVINKTAAAILDGTNEFNLSRAADILTIDCANNGYVTNAPTETISGTFAISKNGAGTGENAAAKKIFLPRVPTGTENGPTTSQQLEQVATSLVNVLNEEDSIVYAYYASGFNDVPGAILLEQQDTTGPVFWLTSNEGQEFNPTLPASGSAQSSTNEIAPNRVYYSKLQQPEAVPLGNYLDVGPKDREIKRIIALRDSLFIFKEDGIYRLSGDVAPFTVAPFDFSTQVLAPDTAVVLNNQIYALSTQGVCQVTDTGVQIISRPIENQLLRIFQFPNFKTASFGVSYESDRSLLLFVPTTETDVVATQAFRYNTFTSSWTKWDKTQTCGLVNFADDKLYMGAGDTNFIEKERKTLTRTDHADREYTLQILLNGVQNDTILLNSIGQAQIGDVLIQTQYLTGAQFDQMLDKLDRDIGVTDQDYLAQLAYIPGQNMRSKLQDLSLKLDADPGVALSTFNAAIADYSYSIASTAPSGSNTVITTTVPHAIKVDRYVTLTGTSNGINGTYKVNAVTSTTMTIARVSIGSTTGTVQTAINDFRDMQSCFNIMVTMLNLDGAVFYTNYPLSSGIIEFEVVILALDKVNNIVTVKSSQGFQFGDIVVYKAIQTTVVWNPIYFQDPSLTKQVREGTMIFENSNFSKVTISYGTDLSPAFSPIIFEGPGLSVGDFGYFAFGTINWGGVSAPVPLRTYIPLEKQRCRFMNVKFQHKVALEKFAIYGLSLTFRPISNRGYR